MSKQDIRPYESAIQNSKDRFANLSNAKTYERESLFALQHIEKNDFSVKIATGNPKSVLLAMTNVASTGLTLNPANAYAYLVPRDGAIVLDISYKGLIKIATDTGAIQWARADLVYENDEFTYNGPAEKPEHKANPFGDRGEMVGAYCIAKTKDGDVLTEVMDRAEVDKIRDKSMAYAKSKGGPWVEWYTQMVKKAVIKRASKTWPYTQSIDRLYEAIDIANESEGGYDLNGNITPTSDIWADTPPEEKEFLLGIADHMNTLMTDGQDLNAAQYFEDQRLTSDEEVALWTRFDSKTRTALKKALAEVRKPQPIEQVNAA